MIAGSFAYNFKAMTVAIAAGFAALANPAAANSSAAADIAAPLRAAQADRPASPGGDEQFRKLFSAWRSGEQTEVPALAAVADAAQAARVPLSAGARTGGGAFAPLYQAAHPAIPSRTPLNGLHMTSDFGMRMHPILGGYRMHAGIDLAAPTGTPIYATADGVVERAEWTGGYGLMVELGHGGDLETRYGHMSRLNVAAGQQVRRGEIIGYVGATGRATGPHLHYEVRVAGMAVNPAPYMQADGTDRAARTTVAANLAN